LASSKKALIKILGSGELTSAITIHAHKFSKSAVEKIEKAAAKLWCLALQRLGCGVSGLVLRIWVCFQVPESRLGRQTPIKV